tara:strand:- start:438 stop:662 length:225 start_codon:yes stop_codon:yes gene_type:complete
LLLALAAFINPSPVMIIIAVFNWMEIARIFEAEVKSLREREFISAGRMLGFSNMHIMFRQLLTKPIGPIIVAQL